MRKLSPPLHAPPILPGFIITLALFGGMQFYLQPGILWFGVAAGWVTMGWALWLVTVQRVTVSLWPSLKWPFAAVIISILANPDIYPTTLGRLWLYALALAVLVISHACLSEKQIYAGIYRAGWLWPGVWLAAGGCGWWDNPNVAAFWPVLFVLVGLKGRNWYYLLPHLGMLIHLGSRGAILGLVVAVSVLVYWQIRPIAFKPVIYAAPVTLLIILVACRPSTATYRLGYWYDALAAFAVNPFFGVGPGGLKANRFIPEPGGGYQINSHNALVTWTAETGLSGLVCLALALNRLRHTPYALANWQGAVLTGLLVHSMVDEPLFWPGPLLLAAMVAGSAREKSVIKNI